MNKRIKAKKAKNKQPKATPQEPLKVAPKVTPKETPVQRETEPGTKPLEKHDDLLYVKLKTSMGDIILELDQVKSPKTVANFIQYVKDGHYDGTIFHRVIAGFMIQGGGLKKDMSEAATRGPIPNEARNGLKNNKYKVAMARTQDPHSATAQFFINAKDNEFLNFTSEDVRGWGYTVFAQVVEGQEVADNIENVETASHSYHDDVPVEPVIIKSAEMLEGYKLQQ